MGGKGLPWVAYPLAAGVFHKIPNGISGQAAEKRHEVVHFFAAQSERFDGRIETVVGNSPPVVEFDDLPKCGNRTVVHVRSSQILV